MKVSGFTIIRNGIYYAYPFKEAILSILPLCDEMIVNVGISNDETLNCVKSMYDSDKKIRIIECDWDMNLKNGLVLSTETNRALKECKGDWCFYIQSDEVLHEKFYDIVKKEMSDNLSDKNIEGLRFRYKHFYGSYDYYQDNYRNWYIREVRIIKNRDNIVSWGDAMDFRHPDGSKIRSRNIDAEIYHYGWVRPPDTLIKKRSDFEKLYNENEVAEINISGFQNYDDLGNLKRFTDKHPEVMNERISLSSWDFDPKIDQQRPDWMRKISILMQPLTKRVIKKKEK
ncbi:MAG TPA: glycosyltransferase family 2 protein [Ignavibacteria bacterium]|nr:glycosyltransferase family 2 protein [Ignavibacteria bacterium]